MRARRVMVLVAASIVLAACGNSAEPATEKAAVDAPAAAAPTSAAAKKADEDVLPAPDDKTAEKYVAALKKIDPEIVEDGEQKVVDRGLDQCGSVKEFPDNQASLVSTTNQRFTSAGHPKGFGKTKAKAILKAVRKYICPEY
ncbi:hypothetical protein [Symbioplanes lichenis]|uniref:hypothetical protein n=1 Tax=Symbioplanes lichenis TaxID=1629072 RepID=UPI0027396A64|nr:hypothetical protein [Actinoplanes lichenis]